MPRDGSGSYTVPPGTDGITGTTIASTPYNLYIHDVEHDLNQPRPIISGGTGATNATTALFNVGGEKATQLVTNYNSQIWLPGSFYSAAVAGLAAPVDGHAFAGVAYLNEALANPPTNQNVIIEARDESDTTTPGRVYIREKKAGVWGAWSTQSGAVITFPPSGNIAATNVQAAIQELDAEKVAKAGDTMTGDLTISKNSPFFQLNAIQPTFPGIFLNAQSGATVFGRWGMFFSDAESAGNLGSNFYISRYSDAGTTIDTPVSINRATGAISLKAVNVSGSVTATSDVNINSATWAQLTLNSTAPPGNAVIGQTSAVRRWVLLLGDGTATYDFGIERYNDAGVTQGQPYKIERATGRHSFTKASATVLPSATHPTTIAVGAQNGGYGVTVRNSAAGTMYPLVCVNASDVGVGSISATDTATAYNTSSDERLKEDLKSFDAGNIVDNTNVYDFKWRSTGERSYGIIAQQAQTVYPAAVTYNKEADWYGIDLSKYVPIIIQELKSLRKRVTELEGKLAAKSA